MARRWRIAGCFWIVCWLLPTYASASSSLSLQDPVPMTLMSPSMLYWCDGDGSADLATARAAQFSELPGEQITFGYRSDACWFKSRVNNAGNQPLPLWLFIDYALLDEIDLYLIDDTATAFWHMGDNQAYSARPVKIRTFTIPLTLSPHIDYELFLRVRTTSSMNVPVSISGRNSFIESYINNDWIVGAFYGVAIGLFFYHLVLWLGAGERASRFYVLHIGATTFYIATLQGVAQRFWPIDDVFPASLPHLMGYLALMSGLLFARDYLQTRQWRWLDRFILSFAALFMLVIAILLASPQGTIDAFQGVMAITTIPVLLCIGIFCWFKGRVEARLFVAAWAVFLVMVMLLALNAYGAVSLPTTLSVHGVQIGLVMQQVLLSFGLATRLNTLKKEAMLRQEEMVRARAESAAKSDFLAKMSHEIRTPMNAVLGLTDLMRGTSLDPTQRNYVETIYSAGNSLLNIINDILDFSKITSGKIELDIETFDLESLLEDCVSIFHASAEQKGIQLIGKWHSSLPKWVKGDSTRLRQVLLNLISNAVKFTERGEIRLSASATAPDRNGEFLLHCDINDQGIGISPEHLAQLFQSFQQGDSSTSRKYGGTGLGLAITRQLVELMGGRVSATSMPEQGSTFSFSVRLTCSKPPTPQELYPNPQHLSGMRVLVVEDNAVNQMVIWALLKRLGIYARIASSGEETLSLFHSDDINFDLVLMDCEMPGLDGYATTEAIRAWEQQHQRTPIPVIALTAHAMDEHRERCFASGMNDHLGKPVTLKKLMDVLSQWAPAPDQKSPP